ncbi:PIR protein [Plasmodium yoelii yoelii]|uniref:PIR protein n=1 Tax=Plasmodium yoelii yoelii TaxID=73239 RepID=A0AAE9WW35_PLAYO|nr:PIR protein [Plasmodium yoelii yoelii]
MAINKVCQKFDNFRRLFPDELKDSKQYDFNNGTFKRYCPNNKCDSDTNIVNAGCLWLINDFFGKDGTSVDKHTYKDDIICIMIWLSYKLSLKTFDNITTLKDFYSNHIEKNTEYTSRNVNDRTYGSYQNIIDKIKEYMDIDISHMSKFYELLKLLCNMHTAYTKDKSNDFSENANQFVDRYKELFNDIDNNIDNSSYDKVLRVFFKYYNDFGKGTRFSNISKDRPPLPTEKTGKKVEVEGSKGNKTVESSSETSQSIHVSTTPIYDTILPGSSLVNKLIPILSIIVAIPIFLGISYKYSLFGFRKRSQKHLREKLKK